MWHASAPQTKETVPAASSSLQREDSLGFQQLLGPKIKLTFTQDGRSILYKA